jgi:Co/Zn/Cd efflux system component
VLRVTWQIAPEFSRMDSCCSPAPSISPGYRRVLWIALIVNAAMFAVEGAAGLAAGSVSLQADALDFFGDAANYGLSLSVLSLALAWRARAALVKGVSMGLFGVWVIAAAAANVLAGGTPHAATMGVVGFAALVANLGVALMLYRYRDGDANMRSVWLCTRNDALGNLAVMAAALGVFGTGSLWPDIAVAAVMASLALSASSETISSALRELKLGAPSAAHAQRHGH